MHAALQSHRSPHLTGRHPPFNSPADVLAATDVTLAVRQKQANAIRSLWATTNLLPRLAVSKRRVMFIQ